MKFTQEQKEYLNGKWDGVEWCPHCNMESGFVVNPIEKVTFICEHCGEEIIPCSLCDCRKCGDYKDCQESICRSLWEFYLEDKDD